MSLPALAPRAKEGRRRDLERKFLANTSSIKGIELSHQTRHRIDRLFKKDKKIFPTETARRDNDIARRHAIDNLMQHRIKAGAQEAGEHFE